MTTINQQDQNVYGTQNNAGRDINIQHFYEAHPEPTPRPSESLIREAQGVLAALPLERIPAPAPLPPGCQISYPINPHFVGRQSELRELAEQLKGGHNTAIGPLSATTGLGGIGKSQLAAAFAHRYGQYFAGGVYWLSFAQPELVMAEIAALIYPMRLHQAPASLSQPEQARLVQEAWQSGLPRLLIFDNCEDESLLRQYRPKSGASRVLVTSRKQSWSRSLGLHALRLQTLPRTESIKLLGKFRADLLEAESPPDPPKGGEKMPP